MNSTEFKTQLARRADRADVPLSPDIIELLFRYFELLARWNSKINLTALPLARPTDETFERLLIEPLRVASGIKNSPLRWFDLGSGGGSPALPIKIARPSLRLTMVESKVRKAAFLRDAVRQLGIESADVINDRFETLLDHSDLREVAELVTIRAVRVDQALIDVCQYLLSAGGQLRLLGFGGKSVAGFAAARHPGLFIRT